MKCEYYNGCTASLTIDGKETVNMPLPEFKEALKKMIDIVDDTAVLQSVFADIMESCAEYEDCGYCEQCGEYCSNYKLEI